MGSNNEYEHQNNWLDQHDKANTITYFYDPTKTYKITGLNPDDFSFVPCPSHPGFFKFQKNKKQ